MMKIHFFFLFFLVFSQCKNENSGQELKPLVIDSENLSVVEIFNEKSKYPFTKIPFSDFADSIHFIKLETTKECLLTNIRLLIFHKNELIVCDTENNELYFFNQKGKYLRKISKKGKGPGEYLNMRICLFDQEKEIFTIFDQLQRKLIKLDMQGNLIQEIPDFSDRAIIYDMIELKNGHYLCYYSGAISAQYPESNNYKGLWEVNSEGVFQKVHFNNVFDLPYITFHHISKFFELPDGTLCLRDNIHKDIYEYHNGEMRRRINFINKESLLNRDLCSQDFAKNDRWFVTFHVKGKYIFTSMGWMDEEPFMSVSETISPAKMKCAEWYDFDDVMMPAIMNTYMCDNNSDHILTLYFSPAILNDYLNDQRLSTTTRKKLSEFMPDTCSETVLMGSPILELIYVKH